MHRLFRRIRRFIVDLLFNLAINNVAASCCVPRNLRWLVMRCAGMRTHPSTIGSGNYFGSGRIEIGAGVELGPQSYYDGAADIVIGPGAAVGPRSLLITGGHSIGGPQRRAGALEPRPIVIGAGAWLGAGVTVLPGVRIGPGAVIAAGALVVRDCEPNGVYAGVPARLLRTLLDEAVSVGPALPGQVTPADCPRSVADPATADAVQ